MKTKIYTLMCFVMVSACATVLPDGTSPFKPAGRFQAEYFKAADFSVFPMDVRKDFSHSKSKIVAWTGIVTDVKLEEPANQPSVSLWRIQATHHYYNWLIDHNISKEAYVLSPSGEGAFAVVISVDRYIASEREKKIADILKNYEKGNLIIGYGAPDTMEGNVIRLKNGFATSVQKSYVHIGQKSYGRVKPPKESFE